MLGFGERGDVMRWLGAVAAMMVAAPAAASLQADYNSAQAAFDAGQWQDARDRFASLLARLPAAQVHTAALIAERTGIAESRLGNPTAAIARLRAALPALSRAGDDDERITTLTELGLAEENAADLTAAARDYGLAAAEPHFAASPLANHARLGLIRVTLFADPARARRDLDALLPTLVPQVKANKIELALLYEMRGSIELNDHKFDAARVWFDKALPLTGGLSDKVTVPAQQIRGDLAIAAFLGGHAEDARRYFAYTGASDLPLAGLSFGDMMPPPPCAPLTALQPDDVAVIEVVIADSGKISRAATIYASRAGGPETLFAAAARDWFWDRDAVRRLPLFWRQALRLEVRCNTSRSDNPIGLGLFRRDIEAWAATARLAPLPDLPDDPVAARPVLAAELARRTAEFGADSPQLFPVFFATLRAGDEAQAGVPARLAALAEAGKAPRDVVWALRAINVHDRAADARSRERSGREDVAAWTQLIAAAVAAGDGGLRAIAYLRLLVATDQERLKDDDAAVAGFQAVIATPTATLPAADPIRQVALLRLASIEAERKQLAAASALYRATGLNAEQCALVDVKPLPKQLGVREQDFPHEALRWGFEGIVRVGYDIDTDGKPSGVRTVTAVPPFVFSAGTEKTAAGFRYRPIFREGTEIGCAGQSENVRYRIEQRR